MKLNLSNRTPEQLLKLLDSVKVSDLPINEKIEDDFIKSFKSVQKAYYKRLIDNNPNLEIYYKGWINRVDKVA